jgi:putative two-component system response regulator
MTGRADIRPDSPSEPAAARAVLRPQITSLPADGVVRCLVVDDESSIRQVIARMVRHHGFTCLEAESGTAALQLLEREGEVALVITDVRMPGLDGLALLGEVRRRYPDTAVIMLTGIPDLEVAVDCLRAGAADYLGKPVQIEELMARIRQALEKRRLRMENRCYQETLEIQVRTQASRIKELFLEGVQTLAHALEAKDPYTSGHSMRVSRYATATARRLGMPEDQLEDIRLGGELHDIGKIGTRESILHKPAVLTPEEFKHITEHTTLGERILAPLARDNPVVLRIVRSHHERIDGLGFPDGLVGETIPLEARVVAVVDAFDAMTTNRAYRASRTPAEAMAELRSCSGTHFDPPVVTAFLEAFPDPWGLPISV